MAFDLTQFDPLSIFGSLSFQNQYMTSLQVVAFVFYIAMFILGIVLFFYWRTYNIKLVYLDKRRSGYLWVEDRVAKFKNADLDLFNYKAFWLRRNIRIPDEKGDIFTTGKKDVLFCVRITEDEFYPLELNGKDIKDLELRALPQDIIQFAMDEHSRGVEKYRVNSFDKYAPFIVAIVTFIILGLLMFYLIYKGEAWFNAMQAVGESCTRHIGNAISQMNAPPG